MIQTWLANKVFGLVVFALACAAVVAVPVAIVQTVRLDGVSFLGFHLIDGAISARDAAFQARDKALGDLATSRANVATLEAAVAKQNAKLRALNDETKRKQGLADAELDRVKRERAGLAAQLAHMANVRMDRTSPATAVISLDNLMREGTR
jgi:hypothetical protein